MANTVSNTLKSIPKAITNATSDLLASSDFVNRTIGMSNSYNDIMFIVQSLGRGPISLLGKDYVFIFDHVRRNYRNGTSEMNTAFEGIDCPKFTFYKEKPTVRFADIDNDILTYHGNWIPDMTFASNKDSLFQRFYAESQRDGDNDNREVSMNGANVGVANGENVASFGNLTSCDIVNKTNDLFNHGRISTLISRFHTGNDEATRQDNTTQTANSKRYGLSHGRNLLKTKPTIDNGYDNPYCRVWTYHHQYHTMEDAIRPFGNRGWGVGVHQELETAEGGVDNVSFRTRKIGEGKSAFYGGSEALDKYGVLNSNGFVNIAPTAKISNYFDGKEDDEDLRSVSPKRCMFSIENLAWKESKHLGQKEYDPNGLSAEQRGPFGGRIMWFPPYNLKFNEAVSVNWNQNSFIGRGEKMYTYTDTERTGNLNFTLLIDHPSLINYWNRDKNSDGGELEFGNVGGVDNVNNEENTLLRFFAGCDVLVASPQKYKERIAKPKDPSDSNSNEKPKDNGKLPLKETENIDANKSYDGAIVCVLYYPNNYSGKDDRGGIVNAVDYLMNGIGAQKMVNENTKEEVDYQVNTTARLSVKAGNTSLSGDYGGYELREESISVVSSMLPLTNEELIKSTYADSANVSSNTEYLTNGSGKIITAKYGDGVEVKLAKQIGDTADKRTQITDLWRKKRWYYRVDKRYANQRLVKDENYLDRVSNGLNSCRGYEILTSNTQLYNSIIGDVKNPKLVSFADMYVALENGVANTMSNLYDEKNVSLIKELKNRKIVDITFRGNASIQGNNPSDSVNESRNNSLAYDRASTFRWWLASKGLNGEVGNDNVVEPSVGDKYNIDNTTTKLWRSASVVIKYANADVNSAQEVNDNEMGVISGRSGDDDSSNIMAPNVNTVSQLVTTDNTSKYKKIDPITLKLVDMTQEEVIASTLNFTNGVNSLGIFGGKPTVTTDSTNVEVGESMEGTNNEEQDEVLEHMVQRYDNEGEFFKLLEKKDPFLHHLVSEKVKYFDPAFHSISPEGFNARLTFLHQCTRQGSTVGASDMNGGNAYNLAFGRPPVCVLRIGDFYYTKIVITSIDIQYDQTQWDLNPEGIGVMPMYADIGIRFTFLGGSDLSGPIARLQNAVSFNYYANASVYDDRAERVIYNDKGEETNFKPFIYPNTER